MGELIGRGTVGILGVAIIQGILAGIGFEIAGVPAAGLFAFIVLFMSTIQINPVLVLIPLSIYMFGDLGVVYGTIFLAWNML